MNTPNKVYSIDDYLVSNLFCSVCGSSSRYTMLYSDPDKQEVSLTCNNCKTRYVDEGSSGLNFQTNDIKKSLAYKFRTPGSTW
jgi:uncharacterized ferredoxin-like protein